MDSPVPADSKAASGPNKDGSQVDKPLGFSRLARQLWRRTTDMIAIAVVLVFGLTVGRQLEDWWATEPADLLSASDAGGSATGWSSGESPVIFETGDRPYVLQRQVVSGDQDRALALSIRNIRRILQSSAFPQQAPDPAERRLLERLKGGEPIENRPGGASIYRIDHAILMLAGVRAVSENAAENSTNPGPAAGRRVVCWTLAFPSSPAGWTIFTVQTTNSPGATPPGLPEVVLPAGSRRVLSLQDAMGAAFVAFEGVGPVEVWAREWDQWCRTKRGTVIKDWERSDTLWTVRYRLGTETHPFWIDIQMRPGGAGQLSTGMLSVTPPPVR